MDTFFLTITWLGSLYLLLPAAVILAILLRRAGRISDFLLLLGGLLGTTVIVHGLKRLFARPRPQAESLLVAMPTDFSFPSAHTAQAAAFACACALIFARRRQAGKTTLLRAGLLLAVFLVGFSRIYLQVHYITDVLAGALIGTLWTFSLYRLVSVPRDEA